MIKWLKDTCKELSIISKKVLGVKDVFLAFQFIAIIIGGIHDYGNGKARHRAEYMADSLKRNDDSCKAVIINNKY